MFEKRKQNNEEKLLKWMSEGVKLAKEEGYDGKFLAWMVYSAYVIENGRDEAFISPEDFKIRIEELVKMSKDDKEDAHVIADHLMGDMLSSFGYEEGVKIFYDMPKWYS